MQFLRSNLSEDPPNSSNDTTCSIMSLPFDLLLEALGRVASSSFTDLFTIKQCCKDLRRAAEDEYVLERISIEKIPLIHEWLKHEEASLFFKRCLESGNPEALYRQGMVEYFTFLKVESGLDHLKTAMQKGHVEASYVYGMILFCSGGEWSLQGLQILTTLVIGNIPKCRERINKMMRAMWVNNINVVVPRQSRFCNHEEEEGNIRLTVTWDGYEQVMDVDCEACRWSREAKLFCNMLSR
ncbi:putative F-box protein At1g67623 [Diospyros lotus]|uniref:putative F-box protein At1g67623 n=1 Tax=Diospyros lotus TaxID=55363 RepID=UPI0022582A0A|nr:putative F-box protein At1g67623 [Diospyros lotus]